MKEELKMTKKYTKLIEGKKESKYKYDQSDDNRNIDAVSRKYGKEAQQKNAMKQHTKNTVKTI